MSHPGPAVRRPMVFATIFAMLLSSAGCSGGGMFPRRPPIGVSAVSESRKETVGREGEVRRASYEPGAVEAAWKRSRFRRRVRQGQHATGLEPDRVKKVAARAGLLALVAGAVGGVGYGLFWWYKHEKPDCESDSWQFSSPDAPST